MKILCIGDLHFKTSNAEETNEMTVELLRIANEIKPELIVVLGDTLDRFSNIHVSPLTRAIHLLRALSKIAEMIVLIGNHDLPNNAAFCSESHPFSSLYEWPSTTIVDKPMDITRNGYRLVFSPYLPNGRLVEGLSSIGEWDRAHLIFCHQEFEGCKMGAMTSVDGDRWNADYPPVISGHIHDYQRVGKVLYPGTPIQHGYSDSSKKTLSVITLNEKDYQEERLSLNVTLKKIVHLLPSDLSNYVPPQGVKIKVTIKASSAEIRILMTSPHIKRLTDLGVTFAYKHVDEKNGLNVRPQETRENYLVALYNSTIGNQRIWFEHIFGTPT